MNKSLFDALIAKGLSPEDATTLATEHAGEFEPTVDTDALAKSLDELRDTFAKGGADEHIAQLEAEVAEAATIVEAVSKGADAVLAEVRAQNDAMSKALLAIGEEIQSLRQGYDTVAKSLSGDVATMKKSIGAATSALGEPVVKSVTTAEQVASPLNGEVIGFTGERHDVINKALETMQTADENRQRQLSEAVAMLEAGADVAETARVYQIN